MKIHQPNNIFNIFKKGVNHWVEDSGGWNGLDWQEEGILFNKMNSEELENINPTLNPQFYDVLESFQWAWKEYKRRITHYDNSDPSFRLLYKILNKTFDFDLDT